MKGPNHAACKYEEMDEKEKEFEYFAKGPGAYWVGEGEKIQTSKHSG